MKIKTIMILMIALTIAASAAIVSAHTDCIKTHEYNFADHAVFNISDDLTNESEFNLTASDSLDVGEYYFYPDANAICSLYFIGADGITDFEGHNESSSYERIDANATPQGYEAHVFKSDEGYDVFIDLNNLTIKSDDGIETTYYYFHANFESINETQIFTDTFKTI